ncbi:MAG: hypothetical protein IJ344_06415, partial [Clostridia bacterium]|nr:hypothetical protein [Clostridia bacterium]
EDMGGFVAESDERIYLDEHEIRDTLIVTYGKDDAPRWADYKIDGGENYRELVFKMPHSSYNNRAMRTHWGKDAKGILAHARIQDFTFADGRKMLFIEEIQSDWHNEGAKFVYEGEDVTKRYEANREKYIKKTVDRDFGKGQYALLKNKPESLSEEELDTMRSYVKELRKEWESKHTIEEYEKNRVPDAPFRKNYYEYVLKRLLRMAAEDGYDAIGWTPADIQVDRWSEDYAESYRIEYDQNIPAFLRKYGKKWGAEVGKTTLPKTKSGPTYFDENRGAEFDNLDQWKKECLRFMRSLGWPQKETENLVFEEEDGYVVMRDKRTKEEYEKVKIRDLGGSVWSMDITDSMKDSVLDEGQPLYSEKKGTSAETSVSTKTDVENVLARASAQMVQRYREDVAMVNELKAHLAEVNGKMGEQAYTRGGRSEGRLLKLRDEAIKTQNRIEILENRIARTEVSAGLVLAKKTTLARERDRVEMRDKKATLRKQIKGTVKRLDTLLTRGTKEKNVKNEQRGVVSSALALADVLFNDVVLNEDLARNGSFSVSEREGRLLDEYRALLDKRDSIKDAIAVMESNPALTREDYLQLDTLRENLKKVKQSIWNKNARLKDVFERVRSDYNKKTAVSLIEDLQREYQALSESKDEYISAAYSEDVYNRLNALKENQKGVTVRAMSESQLAEMLDALRMIEYTVSKANKLFREGRAENFEEWVT